MTREEAIKMIEDDKKRHHDELSGRYRAALTMAIKALEREPIIHCKDCKHNYNTCFNHGVNEPICDFTDRKMKETDFCSFGERRAEQ